MQYKYNEKQFLLTRDHNMSYGLFYTLTLLGLDVLKK